jgi:hypothetical protein
MQTNEQIEKFLVDNGVRTWVFKQGIPIEDFDQKTSLTNQVRLLQPLIPDVVARYQNILAEGGSLPPILAHQTKKGLVIDDGNHRLEAHRLEDMTIDGYIIEAPPKILTRVAFAANAGHGVPTSSGDRIHQAIYLLETGFTEDEVRAWLGVSAGELSRARQRRKADLRAKEVHLDPEVWSALPDPVKIRLGQVNTDEGFKGMAELAYSAGLTGKEVADTITQVNATRSGTGQQAIVEHLREAVFADNITEALGGGRLQQRNKRRSWRQRLNMVLGNIGAIDPGVFANEPVPPAERAELVDRIDDRIERLREIRNSIGGE